MLRGAMRVFVRPTVVPEDALSRLHGRARPLLYVLEERSTSDLLALEIACMDGGRRRRRARARRRAGRGLLGPRATAREVVHGPDVLGELGARRAVPPPAVD